MVLPGLLTGDLSTSFLRRSLDAAGFRAYGWGQGANIGASAAKLDALERRLAELHARHGRKVVLIGWSLGGVFARVLATRMPQYSELVMTVASPFSGDRRANRAWRLYEWLNDHTVDATPFEDDLAARPNVPTIAVWSGVDGVVAPECALGRPDEADVRIRLDAQHFALGSSRRPIARIIEILREHLQPES
jgi:pimeloyl-ACP methyl ester carboxylesterase